MKPRAVLVSLLPLSLLIGCAADGEVKVRASSDESSASASASTETEGAGDAKTTAAAKPAVEGDAPAPSPSPALQVCPLQCFVAQKGRVAPADEQRLTTELADALTTMRACGPGNSLTLRFETGGQLTEFGVDAERGNEGACIQSLRQKKPNVTYPGPSTLRCYERCAGDRTRTTRRRR